MEITTHAGTAAVDKLVEEIAGAVRTEIMCGIVALVAEGVHTRLTCEIYGILIIEAATEGLAKTTSEVEVSIRRGTKPSLHVKYG